MDAIREDKQSPVGQQNKEHLFGMAGRKQETFHQLGKFELALEKNEISTAKNEDKETL